MALHIYIYITLSNLFELKRGLSKYTKSYCKTHSGDSPVYSANNKIPLGMIDTFDYSGRYLTSSVNGIAGKLTMVEGNFSLNADRVILLPKTNAIDLDYIRYVLEPLLRQKVKGRNGEKGKNEYTKIDRESILNTKILIPFNDAGDIDLDIQCHIRNKYQKIEKIREILSNQVDKVLEFSVVF